jgi:hypothetical protein
VTIEIPILFSTPMIIRLRAGLKSQTRRLVKLRPGQEVDLASDSDELVEEPATPKYPVGARLWVRETWREASCNRHHLEIDEAQCTCYPPTFLADDVPAPVDVDFIHTRWRPSIFLRRRHCRMTLRITGSRIERLQAITEEDAKAEGVDPSKPIGALINGKPAELHTFGPDAARRVFALLWDHINGKRAPWASDPLVHRICFEVEPKGP